MIKEAGENNPTFIRSVCGFSVTRRTQLLWTKIYSSKTQAIYFIMHSLLFLALVNLPDSNPKKGRIKKMENVTVVGLDG